MSGTYIECTDTMSIMSCTPRQAGQLRVLGALLARVAAHALGRVAAAEANIIPLNSRPQPSTGADASGCTGWEHREVKLHFPSSWNGSGAQEK